MSETLDPGEFLTPDETARYLTEELGWKTSKATLAKLRCKGGGPPYRRFRTRVKYHPLRLKQYVLGLMSDELHSTSDDWTPQPREPSTTSIDLTAIQRCE